MDSECQNNLFDSKKDFLIAAINDISNNIKFLDTKISILMATMGIILAGLISIEGDIKEIYNKMIFQPAKGTFIIILLMYFLLTLFALFFGILVVIPKTSKLVEKSSLWFFNNYTLEDYQNKIEKINQQDILNNLSYELFKLNCINDNKTINTKRSIYIFSISIGLLLIIAFIFVYKIKV